MTTTAALIACVLVLAVGDIGLLAARIDRIDVAMPRAVPSATSTMDLSHLAQPTSGPTPPSSIPVAPAPSESWLVVGTDSREDLPPGDPGRYGTSEQAGGGERADVLALIQPSETGSRVLVLPRDLAVGRDVVSIDRLATTYLSGPQHTVDLLCSELGITTTHLVSVDMAQFARIVDALGGVSIAIDAPLRDQGSGLEISAAGTHTLDGATALALVRSRRPEVNRDGTWLPLPESEGAAQRSRYTGLMMHALMTALAGQVRNPFRAQALAWSLSGNMRVDSSTSLLELAGLARTLADSQAPVSVSTAPAPTQGDAFLALPTAATYQVLAEHGYAPGRCRPAR